MPLYQIGWGGGGFKCRIQGRTTYITEETFNTFLQPQTDNFEDVPEDIELYNFSQEIHCMRLVRYQGRYI